MTDETVMTARALEYDDLPVTYRVTDSEAVRAEGRFLHIVRGEVLLPLIGIAAGVVSVWVSAVGVVTAIAIAFLAVLRVLHRTTYSDSRWYELRAAAEAVKSTAWRYSVRAAPFDVPDQTDEEAERLFLQELDEATAELSFPPPIDGGDEITNAMRELRNASIDEQRTAYMDGRLQNQLSWYSTAARRNETYGLRFEVLHLLVVGVVVVAGALVVAGVDIAPLLTIGAGTAGAAIAWSDVRRYRALSRAYAHTARRLTLLRSRARVEDTPAEWVEFVSDVERTIDAEHAAWRAARDC
jgi:hypothetical protein